MDADEFFDYVQTDSPVGDRDWMKASAASLAKLNEVGTKVYNIGIADSKQIKVNKHNTIRQDGSDQAKSAWGSSSSIPELLQRQSERISQNKKLRPSSAVTRRQTVPTKTRQRPQSAKELNGEASKKPPSGLGVKGRHRDLEERPPGGVGVGTGTGWAAPSGGLMDMTNAEIDDVLNQVSQNQTTQHNGGSRRTNFSRMSDIAYTKGTTIGDLVEGLVFEDTEGEGVLPSDILFRPPPEPIHVTMPTATIDSDEEDELENCQWNARSSIKKNSSNDGAVRNSYQGNKFNDMEPWDDFLGAKSHSEKAKPQDQGRRSRVVTFNEDMNETTLITPREDQSSDLLGALNINVFNSEDDSEQSDSDEDDDDDDDDEEEEMNHKLKSRTSQPLPKPKHYAQRSDLKHVKSRTDTGINFREESLRATRAGSAKERNTSARSEPYESIATVSVAYIDDLIDDNTPGRKETIPSVETPQTAKKSKRRDKDDIETMISKMALSDEEEKNMQVVGNASKTEKTIWAPSGSLTTKYVSSHTVGKNYYEIALDAKIARNRIRQQGLIEEIQKTKTIKTLDFGDGEVVEHKVVSAVNAHVHNKKEYVVPKEARPQSVLKKKSHDNSRGKEDKTGEVSHDEKVDGDDELTFDKVGLNFTKKYLQEESLDSDKIIQTGSVAKPAANRPKSALRTSTEFKGMSSLRSSKDKSSKSHERKNSEESKVKTSTSKAVAKLYDEFESKRLKKPRPESAPVRLGPTIVNGKLVEGSTHLLSSPYAAKPDKIRPYSASVVNEMKKRQASKGLTPPHPSNIKISAKLSIKEVKRNKSAVKALKKGVLSQQRNYNEDKYYANYTRPPPKAFVPALRVKKMAERKSAKKVEEESKGPQVIEIWTQKNDAEIETQGISDCKRLQDTLLDEGVPVTLDTLTRALLPPNENAFRGGAIVTNTNPTFPGGGETRLLSKPSVWCPEEYSRLQRAKKAVQRAEQSLREQANEERNRMYLQSLSPGSQRKAANKKAYKRRK